MIENKDGRTLMVDRYHIRGGIKDTIKLLIPTEPTFFQIYTSGDVYGLFPIVQTYNDVSFYKICIVRISSNIIQIEDISINEKNLSKPVSQIGLSKTYLDQLVDEALNFFIDRSGYKITTEEAFNERLERVNQALRKAMDMAV